MSDFWFGVTVGIIGVYVVNWLLKQLLVFLVLKIAKNKIDELKKQEEEVLLKIEKHNGVIYCYRKDNDEFIGQGSTLQEVADLFKKKYPHNDGRILKEDADGLMP